jgi:hypothetical protein
MDRPGNRAVFGVAMSSPPSMIHPSEHEEQVAFVTMVKLEFRNNGDFIPELFFAVPNGMFAGGRTPGARAYNITKMKAEGFNTGVADILYLQPRGGYHYLCIEMKREHYRNRPSEISDDQRQFAAAVSIMNGFHSFCFGADHAFLIFSEYMKMPLKAVFSGTKR